MKDVIRLGLIGDNIAASQSPRLHRLAGDQNGQAVIYDRLVPALLKMDFDGVFHLASNTCRGINVTYPYKEVVTDKVIIDDPLVRAIGAVNTVLFDDGGPHGFNTDYSGFIAAYRHVRGYQAPGPVLMIGAGGVGKAVAFGLVALGLCDLRLVDHDLAKANALADALRRARPGLVVSVSQDASSLAPGAEGLINCTPLGMEGKPGTPLAKPLMAGAGWAFDAVYTPPDTQFLTDAKSLGLSIISGYELFLGQGVDAWRIFTGLPLDQARLRADLSLPE